MGERDDLTASLRDAHEKFARAIESIRPALHRYCARMTGSVLDGEDLVQETMAQGYYGLSLLRQEVPLRPWLFRIAHHKCVDFLRQRSARPTVEIEDDAAAVEVGDEIEARDLASHAFSHLVVALPPRERAAVLLKDLLGYELPEIAKILDSTVGGVKSALHRGREKLARIEEEPTSRRGPIPEDVSRYLDAFNRRDWAGLTAMLEAEVRCELVGFVHHTGRRALEDNYFANYSKLSYRWKLAWAEIDGDDAIVCLREEDGGWTPHHAIRVEWRGGAVARIRDYVHVPYLLRDARVVLRSNEEEKP